MTVDYKTMSKVDWITLAEDYHKQLVITLQQLSSRDWMHVTPYLGWRGYEVLAHMASSNTMNFQLLLDLAMKGRPVPNPPFDFFLRNAAEVEKRRNLPIAEVLQEFSSTLADNLSFYKRLADGDWLRPAWFFIGDVNIRTLFLIQVSDTVIHERDLFLATGKWKGFDSQLLQPLTDWFMREFRPATFRHEGTEKLDISILYRLSGSGKGDWTMLVRNGKCYAEQGTFSRPDITVYADTEDLITASLARANPTVGSLSRRFGFLVRPPKREDFVATVTGYFSFGSAVLSKRLRINGDRAKIAQLRHAFWHFGERRKQTEVSMNTSQLMDSLK